MSPQFVWHAVKTVLYLTIITFCSKLDYTLSSTGTCGKDDVIRELEEFHTTCLQWKSKLKPQPLKRTFLDLWLHWGGRWNFYLKKSIKCSDLFVLLKKCQLCPVYNSLFIVMMLHVWQISFCIAFCIMRRWKAWGLCWRHLFTLVYFRFR